MAAFFLFATHYSPFTHCYLMPAGGGRRSAPCVAALPRRARAALPSHRGDLECRRSRRGGDTALLCSIESLRRLPQIERGRRERRQRGGKPRAEHIGKSRWLV